MNSIFTIASTRVERIYAALVLSLLCQFIILFNPAHATPQRMTDKGGNVVWSADYDAYGKAIVKTTANPTLALVNNLRLPGQYYDAETGLHYNDRRYYDADTGRYLARDPIGFEGGINLYAYAAAAPNRFTDPTGEIIPCMAANYARCNVMCNIEKGAMDILKCGEVNWGANAKSCLTSCIFSMLPIPDPCGKFGKLFSAAVGLGAGLMNSFTPETEVHVRPSGASSTDAMRGKTEKRAIKDLKPGDEVLAYAEWKDKGTSLTDDGQKLDQRLSYEKVTDMVTSTREQRIVHVTLTDGQTIQATDGHPFKTTDGWRDAILLKKGGKLLLRGTGEEPDSERIAEISDVRVEQRTVPVFNIEVANAHTFFVGDVGVLVHNGIIYRRTAVPFKDYIGKADDAANFLARQGCHNRKLGRKFGYEKLYEGPETGRALERIEQKYLDDAGGPTNKSNPNGGTSNRRNNFRR